MKKYFKTEKAAIKAAKERNKQVFKIPKGTKHHECYMAGEEIEWLMVKHMLNR